MINSSYDYNKIREDLFCKYCGKQCKNLNSLNQHEIRCKNNPNKIKCIGNPVPHQGWNKGLTKDTDERVKKGSESVSKFYTTDEGIKLKNKFSEMYVGNDVFKDSGRKGGIKSAKSQQRRSKNEIYFCELCESYFKDVQHNESIFNGWDADIIINDIKYAILWNGIWHYKQISKTQSLEQVQTRDKIKLDQIIKCGYTPYIIKDEGRYNKKFVEEQFEIFKNFISNN